MGARTLTPLEENAARSCASADLPRWWFENCPMSLFNKIKEIREESRHEEA